MDATIQGRVYKFGDNINSDIIIPGRYLIYIDPVKLGEHAFEVLGDGFPSKLRDFQILVAGRNFGCGSSREHAPIALGSANSKIILAESFARIFFRNCVATGELYPCECADRLCDVLKTGDVVTVDLDKASVTVQATGKVYSFKPLGDVRPVVDAGGLFNYARQTGMMPAAK